MDADEKRAPVWYEAGVSVPLSCDRDSVRSSLEETTPRSVLERDETVAVSRGPDPLQPAPLITTVRLAAPRVPYLVTRSLPLIHQRAYGEHEADTKHAPMRLRTCSAQGRLPCWCEGRGDAGEIGSRLNYWSANRFSDEEFMDPYA